MKTEAQIRFMKLYAPQHEAFVRFCSARAYGIMETEDLVNESIAAVFQKLDRLRSEQAFLSYLFSTASNIIKNEIRRKKIVFYEADVMSHAERVMVRPDDERADIALLYQALNLLPADQKEALILFEISGYKIKEVAEMTHASEDAIRQRLSRGRKALARLLQAEDLASEPIGQRSNVLAYLFF